MHEAADVSVVISTHNRARVLGPALGALLHGQQPGAVRYEVIVVDNNSSDDTPAVVAAFAGQGPVPLRYVFEPRPGVSYGRNAGIRSATAPIVAFTDVDIRTAPDWIATIKRTFDEHPGVDCLGGPVLPIWETSPPVWLDRRHWSPLSVTDYGPNRFTIDAARPRCLLTSNLAMRRHVFSRIEAFSPMFPRAQDHELQLRYWLAGGTALYLPTLIVHTEVPPERMTKAYHRHWHSRHGRMCGRMHLREHLGPDGSLGPEPKTRRTLFGVPLFLYRELQAEIRQGVRAMLRGDRREAFVRELAARHVINYIRERHREHRDGGRAPAAPMPPAPRTRPVRRLVPHLAIVALLLGSAYDIATDQEHWPFSQYPMFSQLEHDWTHRTLRLFGVTGRSEFALLDPAYLAPFDQCRLSTALLRLSDRPASAALLRAALRDSFERYERGRQASAHAGPPLRGVRLYRLFWRLDHDARNADAPDRRELVAEYDAGER